MLPFLLRKCGYSIFSYFGLTMLSIFPQLVFDLIRLVLWVLKEGENAADFSQDNFGSIRFIGFAMLSIFPQNMF